MKHVSTKGSSEHPAAILALFKSKFPSLSDEDTLAFIDICTYKVFKNKEILIPADSRTRTFGFILSGVFRGYIVNAQGVEKNLFFRAEGSFLGSSNQLISNEPSVYTYESVLESKVLVFNLEDFETLCLQRPTLYQFLLWGLKTTIQTVVYRIETMIEKLPEERYEDLLKKSPIFFQKAFNKHIANYLGITPVSLSRIIKRKKENPNP